MQLVRKTELAVILGITERWLIKLKKDGIIEPHSSSPRLFDVEEGKQAFVDYKLANSGREVWYDRAIHLQGCQRRGHTVGSPFITPLRPGAVEPIAERRLILCIRRGTSQNTLWRV
jgi:hypothetical protein